MIIPVGEGGGGDISLRIHAPIVFPQQRKSRGQIQPPPPPRIAPRRTNRTNPRNILAGRSHHRAVTALLSASLHPSAGLKKETKTHGPTAGGIEK